MPSGPAAGVELAVVRGFAGVALLRMVAAWLQCWLVVGGVGVLDFGMLWVSPCWLGGDGLKVFYGVPRWGTMGLPAPWGGKVGTVPWGRVVVVKKGGMKREARRS